MEQPLVTTEPYRILALDGGGIKGAYTASVLHSLELLTGKTIGEHFDLITGTSTGGIIAIAIGLGIPLKNILDLYVTQGPKIFTAPTPKWRGRIAAFVRHMLRPKHSQSILQESLQSVLGNRRFGESRNRLVIPAFNAVNGHIQLFKTAHCEAYRMDYQHPATAVAMATSAAPTFFDAFTDADGRVFVDGGVWANCPVMVGIVEATAALGWPFEQIEILSIGTTDAPFDINRQRRSGGVAQWNVGLVDLLMAAQVRGTLGLAKALTKDRVVRIDVMTRPGRFSLDNSGEVTELRALGENSARQEVERIQDLFFRHPCAAFHPCHRLHC